MPVTIVNLAWLILLLPLLAAVGITLFTQRDKSLSAGLSIGAVILAFLCSLVLFFGLPLEKAGLDVRATWLAVGDLRVDLGLHLDTLSLLMLLIVTGVGGVIHIYSYGYMNE